MYCSMYAIEDTYNDYPMTLGKNDVYITKFAISLKIKVLCMNISFIRCFSCAEVLTHK